MRYLIKTTELLTSDDVENSSSQNGNIYHGNFQKQYPMSVEDKMGNMIGQREHYMSTDFAFNKDHLFLMDSNNRQKLEEMKQCLGSSD